MSTRKAISDRVSQVELWAEALGELAVWVVASNGYFLIWAVMCYQLVVSVIQI